jgi:large subunit ribosomal protein L10e
MGNLADYRAGKYPFELTVLSLENAQIRNNALEACRQYINKKLDKDLAGQYRFKVIPYPHHIQRENKMLTGAGADRMQTGMQLSFGKAIAKAALVKSGTSIFSISVGTQKGILVTRHAFNQIRSKLPCKIRIDFVDTRKK